MVRARSIKNWLTFLASAVAFAPFGCAMSVEPIGDISTDIDVAEWEGVWIHEESFDVDAIVAVIRVASLEEARIRVKWLEIGDSDTILRESIATLRTLNDALFLNVRNAEEGTAERPRHYWARVEKDDDLVRVWVPHYDRLEEMVAGRVLPGEIDKVKYEITLGQLNAEQERLLSSDAFPTIPVVFRRIGK